MPLGAAKMWFENAAVAPTYLFLWGSNVDGELGNGTSGNSYSSPVQIGSLTTWTAMAGGETFTWNNWWSVIRLGV